MDREPTNREIMDVLIALRDGTEGRFEGVDKQFDGINQKFNGIDQRFDGIDQRFDGIDQRFDGIDQRFDGITKNSMESLMNLSAFICASIQWMQN